MRKIGPTRLVRGRAAGSPPSRGARRHLIGRLSYANIVSTLALFLALGGGGAAATVVFAPGSVGPPQLAFPYASAAASHNRAKYIGMTVVHCIQGPAPKCGPVPSLALQIVAHARLSLDRKGPVEVLATTLLTNKTAAKETAQVSVVVDRNACSTVVTLKAREQLPIVCDGTIRTLPAGSHRVTLFAMPSRQDMSLPSNVTASDTQLVAWTLPPISR
ncbi:MAG: hypothetical protein M3Y17_09335 [Actinomycetota bacterium]|nr:hypothetical protein [Actinomycetota bacterium]